LTGHVPRLRPGERFSRFRPRFHPVFTVPEVLAVERTRSVELRHVSRFITFWPFAHRYPRFDRSVHRIAFFSYSHSYPRMSVHMFHYAVFPRLGRSR
jgi:hypothetical protein